MSNDPNTPNTPEDERAQLEGFKQRRIDPRVRQRLRDIARGKAGATTRERVANVSDSSGMEAWKLLTAAEGQNVARHKTKEMLTMAMGLIRDARRNPATSVAGKLNIDVDSLVKSLQALFSKSMGRKVGDAELALLLDPLSGPTSKVVFERVLGLDANSDAATVQAKLDEMAANAYRISDLYAYKDTQKVLEVFIKMVKGELSTEDVPNEPSLQDAALTAEAEPIKFGGDVVEQMLTEVEQGTPAVPAADAGDAPEPTPAAEAIPAEPTLEWVPTPQAVDVAAFCETHEDSPVMAYYRDLFITLKGGGNEVVALIKRMNDTGELRGQLGYKFFTAAKMKDDASALVEVIAKGQNAPDEATLMTLLVGFQDLIESLETQAEPTSEDAAGPESEPPTEVSEDELIEEDEDSESESESEPEPTPTPAPAPAPTPTPDPEPAGPAIDFDVFYNEMQNNPQAVYYIFPLRNLWGAFHHDDEAYNAKYGPNNFGGVHRGVLESRLIEAMGPVLTGAIIDAAQDDDWKLSLIKAIAKHFKVENDEEGLMNALESVRDLVGEKFPDALHQDDPSKQVTK